MSLTAIVITIFNFSGRWRVIRNLLRSPAARPWRLTRQRRDSEEDLPLADEARGSLPKFKAVWTSYQPAGWDFRRWSHQLPEACSRAFWLALGWPNFDQESVFSRNRRKVLKSEKKQHWINFFLKPKKNKWARSTKNGRPRILLFFLSSNSSIF